MWVFDLRLKVLFDDPDVGGAVIVGLYGGYVDLSEEFRVLEMDVAKSMAERIRKGDKPIVIYSTYQPQQPDYLKHLSEQGVPVFGAVDEAVRIMGVLVEHSERRVALLEEADSVPLELPAGRREKVEVIFARVCPEGRINLVETEAREVLCAYGTDLASHYLAATADEAVEMWEEIGGKVVMKIVSPDVLRKTDAGGVAPNIEPAGVARETFERLVANSCNYKADANTFGVILTPMLKGDVECTIGSSWDSIFGPMITFGLGGIFAEILKDASLHVALVNMPSCRRMVHEINGLTTLQGIRGSKPCDLEALAKVVCLTSHTVDELRDIAEADLNPVFVWGKGLAVADVHIVLQAR